MSSMFLWWDRLVSLAVARRPNEVTNFSEEAVTGTYFTSPEGLKTHLVTVFW